jgi:Domain of unknown function (DUF929)
LPGPPDLLHVTKDASARSGPGSSPKKPGQTAAQKRLAAQRAMAAASGARAVRRKRLAAVVLPICAVVLVAAILIIVKVSVGSSGPGSGAKASAAAEPVATSVTSVPLSALNSVGRGTASGPPTALTGTALTADGKPQVLFIGAEWCPYCAAERWPLAVALSRFGTLTGLGQVTSSPTDVYPSTATLTFHGASYSSTYLSLTAKEIFSNQASGDSYKPLDKLTAAETKLFEDVGKGGFPFLDIGGRYLINSASYDPGILAGKTQAQIAAALSQPSTSIAKAVDGAANMISAALCRLTGGKPASVCTSSGVTAAAALLPGSGS